MPATTASQSYGSSAVGYSWHVLSCKSSVKAERGAGALDQHRGCGALFPKATLAKRNSSGCNGWPLSDSRHILESLGFGRNRERSDVKEKCRCGRGCGCSCAKNLPSPGPWGKRRGHAESGTGWRITDGSASRLDGHEQSSNVDPGRYPGIDVQDGVGSDGKRDPCKRIITVHLYFDAQKSAEHGCVAYDIDARTGRVVTISMASYYRDSAERAGKKAEDVWRSFRCPCKPPGGTNGAMRRKAWCSASLRVKWHATPNGDGGGAIPFHVRCDCPKGRLTHTGMTMHPPPSLSFYVCSDALEDPRSSIFGHEIGHVLGIDYEGYDPATMNVLGSRLGLGHVMAEYGGTRVPTLDACHILRANNVCKNCCDLGRGDLAEVWDVEQPPPKKSIKYDALPVDGSQLVAMLERVSSLRLSDERVVSEGGLP